MSMTRDELAERMRTAECACTHAANSHTMSGCHMCACPLSLWQVRANALLPLFTEAAAEALDDAAAAIYNGASDPEQEFYDHGVSPWLTMRAIRLRAAAVGIDEGLLADYDPVPGLVARGVMTDEPPEAEGEEKST